MHRLFLICLLSMFSLNAPASSVQSLSESVVMFSKDQQITNMQVGINQGNAHCTINMGHQTRYPINSMSKTFATLALAYAAQKKMLHLSNTIADYFPQTQGYPIGEVTLLHLATHTSGLPLSVGQPLKNDQDVMHYLLHWTPPYRIGHRRVYSNLGIGLIGKILEKATKSTYSNYIDKIIITPFAMTHTAVNPPSFHLFLPDSVFIASDGIVSNAHDMNRYLSELMKKRPASDPMKSAIDMVLTDDDQTPYFRDDFGWQAYPWPIKEQTFLRSSPMKSLDTPATALPPSATYKNKLLTKTGSGNGYTSIMAFIPKKQLSVVILIKKDIGMKERMQLAFNLLTNCAKFSTYNRIAHLCDLGGDG